MPGYRAHVTFAGSLFALLWLLCLHSVLEYGTAIIGLCAMLCGSIFPDTDTRSKARRVMNIFIIPLCALLWWKQLHGMSVLALVVWSIGYIAPHRGIMHTIWFPFVMMLTTGYIVRYYAMTIDNAHVIATCFIAGYISHLLLDGILLR